jgi:hypothetical protein
LGGGGRGIMGDREDCATGADLSTPDLKTVMQLMG